MKTIQYLTIAMIGSVCLQGAMAQSLTIYRSDLNVRETAELLTSIIKQEGLNYMGTTMHEPRRVPDDSIRSKAMAVTFADDTLSAMVLACEVTVALDLPLKILIWEEYGDVYMGYFDPALWRRRYMMEDCNETLKHLSRLMSRVVNECIRQGYSANR